MTSHIPLTLAALALTAACSTTSATTTGTTDPSTVDARHRTTTRAPAPGTTVAPGQLPPGDPTFPMPAPGTCHVGQRNGQPIPDPSCTPGAINPAVTQATIGQTICSTTRGPDGKTWNQEQRPPVAKTDAAKRVIAAAYSVHPAGGQNDELDHYVPISLAGAPFDPRNFWVEPGPIPNVKDRVEAYLLNQVCHHGMLLAVAQAGIASDWTQYIPKSGDALGEDAGQTDG